MTMNSSDFPLVWMNLTQEPGHDHQKDFDNILEALSSLARENTKKPMDELLLQALLQYAKTMLDAPVEQQSHDLGRLHYLGARGSREVYAQEIQLQTQ